MSWVEVKIDGELREIYQELKMIPFYKTDGGYRYAAYLLKNTDVTTKTMSFLERDLDNDLDSDAKEEQEQMKKLLRDVIQDLSSVFVTDEVLAAWMMFQKEQEGVKKYHQILDEFLIQVVTAQTQEKTKRLKIEEHGEDANHQFFWKADNYGSGEPCVDMEKQWERCESAKTVSNESTVLNHQNPFADISIEEQSFLYGSIMGQFESLELTTSHTLTKVAKDTEKSYLALQPGFKIKKTRDVGTKRIQDIIFDDTVSTELAQDNENIYVYIDD